MAFSNVTYTGDGAIDEFQIPFEYLSQTHLVITRDGTPDTNGVEFSINIITQKVEYVVAPAIGVLLKIARVTPIATDERPVDFEGGSGLGEDDLDSVALVSIFLAQEADDDEGASLALKADITYVDAQVAANSVADQAYADALAIAAGAGDVSIGGGTTTTDEFLQWNATGTKVVKGGIAPDTDVTLAADSDTKLATQKATKAYTDAQIDALVDNYSNPNLLYNSGYAVDIESNGGSGVTSGNEYVVEGWQLVRNTSGAMKLSRDTTVVSDNAHYSLKMDITTADTSVTSSEFLGIRTLIEGYDVSSLKAGTANAKTVTFSFPVRSSIIGKYCIAISNAAADRSYVAEYEILVADTWEDKVVTIPLDQSGSWSKGTAIGLEIMFTLMAGATIQGAVDTWASADLLATTNQVNFMSSSANNFYLGEVKLEEGVSATTWSMPSQATEAARMSRFARELNHVWVSNDMAGSGYRANVALQPPMRGTPSTTINNNSGSGVVFATSATGIYQTVNNSTNEVLQVRLFSRLA